MSGLKCLVKVSPDSWHFYPCGNPAKFTYIDALGKAFPVCGIHRRSVDKSLSLQNRQLCQPIEAKP
jgi:hypothetical protein